MKQITLNFGGHRVEHEPAYVTWLEGGEVRRLVLFAYCVDYGWPWWKPFDPKGQA